MIHRNTSVRRLFTTVRAVVLTCIFAAPAYAADVENEPKNYTRSVQSYQLPEVTLRNHWGKSVELRDLIVDDRPVLLQFIFTSCQTVCPMLTATMARAQDELRNIRADTRIISVSIDPDYDTPERLKRYAAKHGAKGDWVFLTGEWSAVRQTLNAFDAMYEGRNKMYHKPYTFMRFGGGSRWVRLRGLMGANQLVAEYQHFLEEASAQISLDSTSTSQPQQQSRR